MTLQISDELSLPDDTVTSTLIVYGGRGMGKTNLLSVVLEELSARNLRWLSIDPVGVHYGLRHGANGRGDGVPCVILGGVHGDMPIEPTSGAVVAELVANGSANVIVDCSRDASGRMWTVGERTRFIATLALELFVAQGQLVDGQRREPLFVALDEAARYVPQTIPHGNPDLARCLGAWEQLVEVGRNVGLGCGLFTQRSARLNKSVAELADAMIAFRTTGPNSITAITDWLGEHVAKTEQRAMVEQIRKLPRGTALVVSPGWLSEERIVAIRARRTFDSSATPKPGESARRITGTGAKPDLEAYRERLAEIVERVDADDPVKLRARIKELEQAHRRSELENDELHEALAETAARVKELSNRPAGPPEVLWEFLEVSAKQTVDAVRDLVNWREHHPTETPEAANPTPPPRATPPQAPVDPIPPAAPVTTKPRPETRAPAVGAVAGQKLGAAQTDVLTVLAQHGQQDAQTVAILTGRSAKGGGFRNALGALRSAGYVQGGNGGMRITAEGEQALGDYEPLPTGRKLRLWWADHSSVPGVAARALEELNDVYPGTLSAQDIAARLGASAAGGGFRNAMGRLRSLGLAHGGNQAMRLDESLAG